jgi:hypothetical protein
MRISAATGVVLAVAIAAGCSHAPLAGVRFKNQPPVWRVNDRRDVPTPPREREYYRGYYHTDSFVVRRLTRILDVPAPTRALDINSLDEVPDSTWFTNRIGVRDMSLEEIRRGPNVDPSPINNLPWKITGAKVGGLSVGFQIEDSKGDRYLMKFDQKAFPELETGAHIIGHRIMYACGYNLAQDHVAYVKRSDITIAPDAKKKSLLGKKTPLTVEDLDRVLATVAQSDDGTIRVLVSRYLSGKPIGPFAREGTREDDPNDLIPHERRRVLRGQVPIFAWLDHTDIQEDQSLDTYVEEDGVHFVKHNMLDFGKALGVMGFQNNWKTVGYTFRIDFGIALKNLLGLGILPREWDEVETPPYRGIGLYEVDHYNPGTWRENSPYWPHLDKDRSDAFWGSKLVMRFTREQLAAIVDEAHYTDPRAAAYMLETLIARQRKTARYWFARIAPLDRFTVEPAADGARVCFDDLMLTHQLADVGRGTTYQLDAFDYDDRATGWTRTVKAPATGGHVCVDGLVPATSRSGYTIVRVRVRRSARTLPILHLHLAQDEAGTLQVIGLRRD